jgi:hypothetical protein
VMAEVEAVVVDPYRIAHHGQVLEADRRDEAPFSAKAYRTP